MLRKKKSRKKYFHFQSSPFEIEFLNLKIVRSSSRFFNSFLTTIFPNENLLSFEKFLKNDDLYRIFDLLLHVKITSCLSRYLIYSIEPLHLSSNFVNFSNLAENLKLPLPFRKIPIIKLINSQE